MECTGSFFFTSESVTEGHPDKMADQISDAVLDAVLEQDPRGRVACETLLTTGIVIVAGEITTSAHFNVPDLVRKVVGEIGYDDAEMGFDCKTCSVLTALQAQSPDIAMGVDRDGAGDQGMMFGYACRETPELMPMPITLAHQLALRLSEVRKQGKIKYLRPDGKSQVSVEYRDGRPFRLDAVVISSQHDEGIDQKRIRQDILTHVVKPVVPAKMLDAKTKYFVNPTGQFIIGGPHGDTGLTGRKIIVDTYGGMGRHGGGCFSGKDPSKVDRSAAYMSRYIAKNVVAAGLAERCEIQLSYAIGVAEPTSVMVDSFCSSPLSDEVLARIVRQVFPLTPKGIIEHLRLRQPIYRQTASYGHFGRDVFPWEKTNQVEALKKAAAPHYKKK